MLLRISIICVQDWDKNLNHTAPFKPVSYVIKPQWIAVLNKLLCPIVDSAQIQQILSTLIFNFKRLLLIMRSEYFISKSILKHAACLLPFQNRIRAWHFTCINAIIDMVLILFSILFALRFRFDQGLRKQFVCLIRIILQFNLL